MEKTVQPDQEAISKAKKQGFKFADDDKTLQKCSKLSITKFIIPEGVTKIGECLFAGSGLTSVVIPNSVSQIENDAFRECTGLTSVKILDGVTKSGRSNRTFRRKNA